MFTIVYLWRIYIEKKKYLLNPSYYIFYLFNTFKNRVTVSLVCFYAFQNLARILSFGTEHGRLLHRGHTLLLPSLHVARQPRLPHDSHRGLAELNPPETYVWKTTAKRSKKSWRTFQNFADRFDLFLYVINRGDFFPRYDE